MESIQIKTKNYKTNIESLFYIPCGVFYFAEFLKQTDEVYIIYRFDLTKKFTNYLRISRNFCECTVIHDSNIDHHSNFLLKLLNLITSDFSSISYYEKTDKEHFNKYYNLFHDIVFPKSL